MASRFGQLRRLCERAQRRAPVSRFRPQRRKSPGDLLRPRAARDRAAGPVPVDVAGIPRLAARAVAPARPRPRGPSARPQGAGPGGIRARQDPGQRRRGGTRACGGTGAIRAADERLRRSRAPFHARREPRVAQPAHRNPRVVGAAPSGQDARPAITARRGTNPACRPRHGGAHVRLPAAGARDRDGAADRGGECQ